MVACPHHIRSHQERQHETPQGHRNNVSPSFTGTTPLGRDNQTVPTSNTRRNTARPLPQPPKRGELQSLKAASSHRGEQQTAAVIPLNTSTPAPTPTSPEGSHHVPRSPRQSPQQRRTPNPSAPENHRNPAMSAHTRGRELAKSYSTTDIVTQAPALPAPTRSSLMVAWPIVCRWEDARQGSAEFHNL